MKIIKPIFYTIRNLFPDKKYGKRVISSNVTNVKFEDDILYVTFIGKRQYAYPGSSKEEYKKMLKAKSKGKFVWNNLRRTNRPYIRVR
ncbi:MAG: hypothetical protein KatS3mg068_1571 [Candidatus Sericytochromatia bacterium]|nr:MAG: hypothetical protein KatS3mg068_1571 [Candidatus Sericytochromatia bacterium]